MHLCKMVALGSEADRRRILVSYRTSPSGCVIVTLNSLPWSAGCPSDEFSLVPIYDPELSVSGRNSASVTESILSNPEISLSGLDSFDRFDSRDSLEQILRLLVPGFTRADFLALLRILIS